MAKVDYCFADYNFLNEEKGNFAPQWNSNVQSNNQTIILNAFKYTRSDTIDGSPYFGVYNNYWGGGYVYSMNDSQYTTATDFIQNLTLLQQLEWIDRQTRAVFVEFSLFNPNVNLFAYVTILFEFLPTGNILPSMRIAPMTLIEYSSSYLALKAACNILYLIFIMYFAVKEMKEFMKTVPKIEYFKRFWSYVEWTIFSFSWAAFSMNSYRIYEGNKIAKQFAAQSGQFIRTDLIRLQSMANWNESLAFCLGFCSAMSTLKFLRLLRFNTRISIFMESLKKSAGEIINFLILFMIMFMAFVQLFYLTLNEKAENFSTVIKTMQTSFDILLGKFYVDPIFQANLVLGPLYFSAYNIVAVLILINIFLTIITDTFDEVRKERLENADKDIQLVNFFVDKIKAIFRHYFHVTQSKKNGSNNGLEYKDSLASFPNKVDGLVKVLINLYNFKDIADESESKKMKITNKKT